MATITERNSRGRVVYCVQVRVQGHKPESRTFPTRKLAQKWGQDRETELRYGVTDLTKGTKALPTLKELTLRYESEIKVSKWELGILNQLRRQEIANKPIDTISSEDVAAFKFAYLERVKAVTLQKYIRLFRRAIKRARVTWKIKGVVNPFEDVGLKATGKPRERTITDTEYKALVDLNEKLKPGFKKNELTRVPFKRILDLALETAMRRGEIVKIRASHISEDGKTLYIPETKTDTPRTIPLSPRAQAILQEQLREGTKDGRLFPYKANQITKRFTKLCKLCNIIDLHFHDLRHTALSRYDRLGFSKGQLKLIGGHRTDKMLFRYLHADLSDTLKRMTETCST